MSLTETEISANNIKITNLRAPTADNDAETEKHVNDKNAGTSCVIDIKDETNLNSHQIWFGTADTSRINEMANSIETVSPSGIILKSGNTSFLSLTTSKISIHDKQLKNLASPTDENDAPTKSYVNSKITVNNPREFYKRIIYSYKHTFWISSGFPLGLENERDTISDPTGNGLTITGGSIISNLVTNTNTAIHSSAIYIL